MKVDRLCAFAFFACAVVIAGCGGNSLNIPSPAPQTPGPTLSPTATPTPVVLPTQAPYQMQAVQTLTTPAPAGAGQTPAPIPVALPAGAPITGTIALSATHSSVIPPNTQIAVGIQNSAPGGIPSLQSVLRKPEAARRISASSNVSVISYLSMLFSQPVQTAPSFSFTIPPADVQPNTSYYVGFFNPNTPSLGWQLGFEGPGKVSGTTVTFSGARNVTFSPYVYYWFGLYAVSQAAQTPTPAPSVAPTQAPTAAPSALPTAIVTPAPHLTLTPSSLNVYTGFTNLFSASDASYSGVYTASSTNTGVATITQTLPGLFTVTGVAAGSAIVTVLESTGTSATESVTVIPTPAPNVSINPTLLSFLSTGSTLPFTASDVNYSGSLTVSSSNISVATVKQTSPGTFAVTSVAAGTATITVRESNGASATCAVTVTTTTIPVN